MLFTAAHNPRGKAALVIDLESGPLDALFNPRKEEARRNLGKIPAMYKKDWKQLKSHIHLIDHKSG